MEKSIQVKGIKYSTFFALQTLQGRSFCLLTPILKFTLNSPGELTAIPSHLFGCSCITLFTLLPWYKEYWSLSGLAECIFLPSHLCSNPSLNFAHKPKTIAQNSASPHRYLWSTPQVHSLLPVCVTYWRKLALLELKTWTVLVLLRAILLSGGTP